MSSAAATPLIYVECDVPEGMTLAEWRSRGAGPSRRRRLTVTVRRMRTRLPV